MIIFSFAGWMLLLENVILFLRDYSTIKNSKFKKDFFAALFIR